MIQLIFILLPPTGYPNHTFHSNNCLLHGPSLHMESDFTDHTASALLMCTIQEHLQEKQQFTLDAYNSRMKPLKRAATFDSFLTNHQFYF